MLVQCNVERLPIQDNSVDMVFSDPPYVKDLVHTYRWLACEAARILKPGKFVAVMCGGNSLNKIMRWFDDAGLMFYWLYQVGLVGRQTGVVWKNGNQNVPISTRTKHVLVYSKGFALSRTATTGLYWAGRADKRWHHWGQDVDSHRYYIDCFSTEGDLVVDPMCGGGTTAVACEILNRRYIIGDLDWQALQTSQLRLSDGKTPLDTLPLFSEVCVVA